jgi:glycine oxidase
MLSHYHDYPDLARTIQTISSKLSDNQFYKKLTPLEISELEPEISKFQHGYYFPVEGQIDSQQLLHILSESLIDKKVTINNIFVDQLQPGKILANNKSYSFDIVFDCRGLGAKEAFKDLRSVRGELIWLQAPHLQITRPIRLMHPRYNLYIAPRPNHQYIVGASEIESDDTSPISVQTTLELLTAAYSINSNFSEARIIKTAAHCRPTLANHLPKIKYRDGLVSINGLYRHGFLIAPSLALDIQRWINQGIYHIHYPQLWEKDI